MGDIKRQKKKYSKPKNPWESERITQEKVLMQEYGFKNKKELWRLETILKNLKKQAKFLIAKEDQKRIEEFLDKLKKQGLLIENAKLEDVLNLKLEDLAKRRLQSMLYSTGMARTIKQARQFITHKHIMISGKKISSPSYLVKIGDSLHFDPYSPLCDASHPERIEIQKKQTGQIKIKEEKPQEIEV